MWYYDEYLKSEDIHTKLYSIEGNSANAEIGTIDSIPTVTVTHEWSTGTAGWLHNVAVKGRSWVHGLLDSIEKNLSPYNDLSSSYNRVTQENQNMKVEYAGTKVDVTMPTFTKVFLCDDEGVDTRKLFTSFIKNMKLLGKLSTTSNTGFLTMDPPNDFKYTIGYDSSMKLKGTYVLESNKFKLNNLVVTDIKVTSSDNLVKSGSTKCPLFIRADLSFQFAKLMDIDNFIEYFESSSS